MRDSSIPVSAILEQVEKILASTGFVNADRLSRLLCFVVDQTLESGEAEISEYLLAEKVFNRPGSFDPRLDSIVRVEARRLRARLEKYYHSEGQDDPIEIYFRRKGYVPAFRRRAPQPGVSQRSIGVLPLENLSGDPEQQYFADGLTDALITELAKIEKLRVISRTTMMRYRNTDKVVPVISQELDLSEVIEGTVMRDAGRVRITVQLLDARTDRHIWAESYERELSDVLKLQRDVVSAVVSAIRIKLTPEDTARMGRVPQVKPKAYEAFLKGTYTWHRFSLEAIKSSIGFFEQAIAEDPGYAPAHAWLANCFHVLAIYGFLDPTAIVPAGETAARKALELDAELAEAQAMVAAYEGLRWNFRAAEHGFRRALNLNPGWAHGHHMFAVLCLTPTGCLDEAVEEMERATELDPLSLPTAAQFAFIRNCRREFDHALQILQGMLKLDPVFPLTYTQLGDAYLGKERYTQAVAAYRKAQDLEPASSHNLWRLANAYAAAGDLRSARGCVHEFDSWNFVQPSHRAMGYHAIGDRDRAFEWFAKAVESKDPALPFVAAMSPCHVLRSDPRFIALLRQMGCRPGQVRAADAIR